MTNEVINRSFSSQDIAQIGADLDRSGFVCLDQVVDRDWIERARNQVDVARRNRNIGIFTVLHPGNIPGTPTEEIAHSPALTELMKSLAEYAKPPSGRVDEDLYTVLRVVGGGSQEKVVPLYHYDSSTLTVLVPVYIPDGKEGFRGDLVVFPNRRRFRGNVLSNVIEKSIVQSRRYNARAHEQMMAGDRNEIKDLVPGNLYLFWGYRSYHGNFGCAPGALRATLLLHFGNPHDDSGVLRMVRWYRIWRIKRAARGGKQI